MSNSSNFVQVLGSDLLHPIDGFEPTHTPFLGANIIDVLDLMN